jgi:outer membrane beta-barrel protein
MESRLLLLLLALAAASLTGCGRDQLVRGDEQVQAPVIEPDVDRREIKQAKIDTENFEVGIFAGGISVEDFGVNRVAGATFAYHITEGFFLQLGAGQADTKPTSFERLSGAAQLLTDSERQYKYYNLSLGYNIFPGEGYIGKDRALNTATYLIGGVGKTTFAGDDRFTVNIGMGLRLMPLDWLAVHAEFQDQIFDIDLLGEQKTSHNLQALIGVTFFF